jgi:hypothetical protein
MLMISIDLLPKIVFDRRTKGYPFYHVTRMLVEGIRLSDL